MDIKGLNFKITPGTLVLFFCPVQRELGMLYKLILERIEKNYEYNFRQLNKFFKK